MPMQRSQLPSPACTVCEQQPLTAAISRQLLAGTKLFVLLPPAAAVVALGYETNHSSPSWRQVCSLPLL